MLLAALLLALPGAALDQSQFIKDTSWLETDAATGARFKRTPGLKDLITQTLYEIPAQ